MVSLKTNKKKSKTKLLTFAALLSGRPRKSLEKILTSFIVWVNIATSIRDQGRPFNTSAWDLVWRMSKGCSFLTVNNLRFMEDLTAADKAQREKLQSLIDAAKKEWGKKAQVLGIHVTIDGKEICPLWSPLETLMTFAQMDTSSPP